MRLYPAGYDPMVAPEHRCQLLPGGNSPLYMKIILCLAGFGLLLATSGCLVEDRGGRGHYHDHDHGHYDAVVVGPPVVVVRPPALIVQ